MLKLKLWSQKVSKMEATMKTVHTTSSSTWRAENGIRHKSDLVTVTQTHLGYKRPVLERE